MRSGPATRSTCTGDRRTVSCSTRRRTRWPGSRTWNERRRPAGRGCPGPGAAAPTVRAPADGVPAVAARWTLAAALLRGPAGFVAGSKFVRSGRVDRERFLDDLALAELRYDDGRLRAAVPALALVRVGDDGVLSP